MNPEMIRRHGATAATMNKYRKRDFDWARAATCLHMGFFHLGRMGHRRPDIPPFRSALGAAKALKASPFATTAEVIDSLRSVTRIAPAALLLGDLAAIRGGVGPDDEGDEHAEAVAGMGGLAVAVGNGRLFGWTVLNPKPLVFDPEPGTILACWRL